MKKQKKSPKTFSKKPGIIIFVVGLLLLPVAGAVMLEVSVQNRIAPGVFLGERSLAWKTPAQAQEIVETYSNTLQHQGFRVRYNDTELRLNPEWGVSADLDITLYAIDSRKTAANAFAVARKGTPLERLRQHVALLLEPTLLETSSTFNSKEALSLLEEQFKTYEEPGQDAQLIVMPDLSFSIQREKIGKSLELPKAVTNVRSQILTLRNEEVVLSLHDDIPSITKANAEKMIQRAEDMVSAGLPTFIFEDQQWHVPESEYRTWLALGTSAPEYDESTGQAVLGVSSQDVFLHLQEERVGNFLKKVAAEIDLPAQEGKFRMQDGKVAEFQESRAGREVDQSQTYEVTKDAVLTSSRRDVSVVVKEVLPRVTNTDVNNLGIKELLGVGRSNFAGSPKNRRHNIANGASLIDGTLVAPDEEFSLLKVLGDFGPEDGWLPELVIKGDKTVPEFGGGACQFGTTVFRATLASGLPVTQRRNHSYVVSYYNDTKGRPGTDATIYDPAPDYRFKNDTGHWILIETEIKGDDFTVAFYGTKDGRKIAQSETRVGAWVDPPPLKNVETEDLAPGETKCIEKAHRGTSTAFDYSVEYADGRKEETTFTSKYKPWQAVCLVGKAKTQ